MSLTDPVGVGSAVPTVPATVVLPGKPNKVPPEFFELWIHALCSIIAITCITVLSGLGRVDGTKATSFITTIIAISGFVTGCRMYLRRMA